MWGKKAKKNSAQPVAQEPEQDAQFSVHTMDDDINSAPQQAPRATHAGGEMPTPPPVAPSEPAPQEASPFLQADTAPQSAPVAGEGDAMNAPFAEASADTDGPSPAQEQAEITLDDNAITLNDSPTPAPQDSMGRPSFTQDDTAEKEMINQETIVSDAYTDQKKDAKTHSLLMIIIGAIGFLLVVGIVAGWFWFSHRSDVSLPDMEDTMILDGENMQDTEDTQIGDIDMPPVDEPIDVMTYSMDLPNTLVLADRTTALATFKKHLNTIAQTMRDENMVGPVTFLFVDDAQIPLPFRTFAQMVRLDLPEEFLSATNDSFELYAYKKGENVYFGLGVDMADAQKAQEVLLSNEWQMPKLFSGLFVGTPPTLENPVFHESTYRDFTIRYINFPQPEGASIDYTVTPQRFFVATTKDMMRAMLDKLFGVNVGTQEMSATTDLPEQTGGDYSDVTMPQEPSAMNNAGADPATGLQ